MSLKTWWQIQNRKAKVITVLCTLIILNTGLCFLIPTAAEWATTTFNLGHRDPMSGLGLMMLQAILDVLLLPAILVVAIAMPSGKPAGQKDSHD